MQNITITVCENLTPYRDPAEDAKPPTELARFTTASGVTFDHEGEVRAFALDNLVMAIEAFSGAAGNPVTVKVFFETTNF